MRNVFQITLKSFHGNVKPNAGASFHGAPSMNTEFSNVHI